MSRKTIRVSIPFQKPDEFAKLLKKIADKNTALGTASPLKTLTGVNMTTFTTKRTEAEKLRAESEALRQQSENKMEQARTIYGTAKGQTSTTPSTLYNMVNTIKEYLLVVNKGNEEALGEWGFNVVIGAAASPKKKKTE